MKDLLNEKSLRDELFFAMGALDDLLRMFENGDDEKAALARVVRVVFADCERKLERAASVVEEAFVGGLTIQRAWGDDKIVGVKIGGLEDEDAVEACKRADKVLESDPKKKIDSLIYSADN
jgi:hypothetical protein